MFKVSFKENPKFPIKKVQRFNNNKVTIVTLKGVLKLPKFLQYGIPREIFEWMETCKNVEVGCTMLEMFLTIKGKAIRADLDVGDYVLGERLAEARAKLHLYDFMEKFCNKLLTYYGKILTGEQITNNIENPNTLYSAHQKYCRLYNREYDHIKELIKHDVDFI